MIRNNTERGNFSTAPYKTDKTESALENQKWIKTTFVKKKNGFMPMTENFQFIKFS